MRKPTKQSASDSAEKRKTNIYLNVSQSMHDPLCISAPFNTNKELLTEKMIHITYIQYKIIVKELQEIW